MGWFPAITITVSNLCQSVRKQAKKTGNSAATEFITALRMSKVFCKALWWKASKDWPSMRVSHKTLHSNEKE